VEGGGEGSGERAGQHALQYSEPIFKWCLHLFGECNTLALRGKYVMLHIAFFVTFYICYTL